LETNEIIKKLEYILNTDININTDLLFFDEIQECPNAINSLKFFCEDLPELAIISAGSYL
jgi:predicted AAA+ superfamily ATPase